MITGDDVYRVTSAIVPLYLAVGLGYASVRWWSLFDRDQCGAINRYVAVLAVPFLSFQLLAETNLYEINGMLIAADSVSKAGVLGLLWLWARLLAPRNRPPGWAFDWVITTFQVSALPNTLIIGIPVLGSMYGLLAEALMAQLVVAQTVIWFTLVLVLFELRAAKQESFRVMSLRLSARQLVPELPEDDSAELDSSHADDCKESGETMLDTRWESSHPKLTVKVDGMGRKAGEEHEPTERIESMEKENSVEAALHSSMAGKEPRPQRGEADGGHGDSPRSAIVHFETPMPEEEEPSDSPEGRGGKEAVARSGSLSKADRATMGRMTLRILARKLSGNFTLWAALIGVVYSLLSYGLDFGYPRILKNSVRIVAQTGLGMAMFSLGLFMANQNRWIPCGLWTAAWTGALRFVATPALMAALSAGFGLRGDILRTAIVQAALPQGVAPFVFASEYKVHPEVISTGVILGTLASLPILLTFYILLGL